jgi:hypothetical protein
VTPSEDPRRPGSDPLLDFVDEARAAEHLEARQRERRLLQQAEEEASLAGTLLDLAERGTAVTVRTETGRAHRGLITTVAHDFVALRTDGGTDLLVRLAAVVVVRPHAGERQPAATGDRPAPSDARLVEVLAELAPDRTRVGITCRGVAERLAGELRAVGLDVVTLRLDGDPGQLCYVQAQSVLEVFFTSG